MNINNWNEKDFSNSRKQSENYLKDYKLLISKGLKNWTKTDFKKSENVYNNLVKKFGKNKTRLLLQDIRIKTLINISNKKGR